MRPPSPRKAALEIRIRLLLHRRGPFRRGLVHAAVRGGLLARSLGLLLRGLARGAARRYFVPPAPAA
jgi:hypothetical protein